MKRVALANRHTANRQRTADNRQWTMHRVPRREKEKGREWKREGECEGHAKMQSLHAASAVNRECAAQKLHIGVRGGEGDGEEALCIGNCLEQAGN